MEMQSMNVLVSKEVYTKFRVKCLEVGKPVKAVIADLILIYCEDIEDEPTTEEKNPAVEESKTD